MEFISDNVSIDKSDERLSIVISQKLDGWKRSVFVTWFVFWALCGIFLLMGLVSEPLKETKLVIAVMLVFWTYYAWKIGKALMWRLKGVEQWRLSDGALTVKDSINGYGKARQYFVENIENLGLMDIDESSWKWQMSNSFWQIGGERIGFEYLSKRKAIGKGLSQKDAEKVLRAVQKRLKEAKRA